MSDYLAEHHFDEPMLSRQRLLWAISTRRQLERWEPYVARDMAAAIANEQLDGADIWAAESEHHFLLIAARNLVGALDLPPESAVVIEPGVRADLIAARGVLEHWKENMPAFNTRPRRTPRNRDARAFADRNPRSGPFDPLDWTNRVGPLVLPNVPASTVHELVDAAEAEALAARPELAPFIPPRAASPWRVEAGEWIPRDPRGLQSWPPNA